MTVYERGMLSDYIASYLELVQSNNSKSTYDRYRCHLRRFFNFIITKNLEWQIIFSPDTLKRFLKNNDQAAKTPIVGLAKLVYIKGDIDVPIKKHHLRLPEIYESYLTLVKKDLKSPSSYGDNRLVLRQLYEYLESRNLNLPDIKIEHIDDFLAVSHSHLSIPTKNNRRFMLRKFLRHLYHRSIIRRDLALFITGIRNYNRARPPKFLRHDEIKRLFAGLKCSTAQDLRLSAMVHLSYTMGLRPKEISIISLDDISFQRKELTLHTRKSFNPIRLSLPDETIKAIAAYIIGGRPKTESRFLFMKLTHNADPIKPWGVAGAITTYLKTINPSASVYWLRHTYAQNLLEQGVSMFEIKEMLGHENFESTGQYLSIHTKMMRRMLFDEEI